MHAMVRRGRLLWIACKVIITPAFPQETVWKAVWQPCIRLA